MPRGFVPSVVGLIVVFSWPLYQLMDFSVGHELYSHIILIPLISVYLVWQGRKGLPGASAPNKAIAGILLGIGAAFLIAYGAIRLSGTDLEKEDSLALATSAFVACFAGTCGWFLGRMTMRAIAFPLAFLLFMVPFPNCFISVTETFLQHGSAAVAHAMFSMAGTTVFFHSLTFQLSTITIQVAPECSGIHSSLALLITSVLAGYFFLKSVRNRLILALAVIPLALLRNGFRVFVLGELCVHVSPKMIDSYIHHQGGPIFFALSLIPFFLLLFLLVKLERRARSQTTPRA